MATVRLNKVNKIYNNNKGKGTQAVFDFSIDIQDKEFIVFVGPSGCGKSTTLRMIAGLEEISSGELFIDNEYTNYIAPKDRNIAMVFQSYALYPHLTVYDNLAFGLRIRKVPVEKKNKDGNVLLHYDRKLLKSNQQDLAIWEKELIKLSPESNTYETTKVELENLIAISKKNIEFYSNNMVPVYKYVHMSKEEIDERVLSAAKILQITEYLKRKPKELSGGQRQRVALGRAIVRKPKVFLMDEPLSNLDAKLRVQMRSEIVRLHKEVGATTIYVTHDQTEAMTMADRIVIMKDGYVQQIGTPKEVYNNPANIFVAGFLGAPSMNFISCSYENGIVIKDGPKINLNDEQMKKVDDYLKNHKCELTLGFRPEDIKANDKDGFDIEITLTEMLGSELLAHFTLAEKDVIVKITAKEEYRIGEKLNISIDSKSLHLFDSESGLKII